MSASVSDEPPMMQRLYDNIWLLAVSAIVFFAVIYLGWGLMDILSVPAR